MIHHFNQRVTADAKRYHTCLYVKCAMIYDHVCTESWRSVSASGHGNMILKLLPRPTRVRSPGPQTVSMINTFTADNNMKIINDKEKIQLDENSMQIFFVRISPPKAICQNHGESLI